MSSKAGAKDSTKNHLRIGWITTANGEGSRGMFLAVLDAIKSGNLNAEFEFVFVNRIRGQTEATDAFLDLVEKNDIPLVTISSLHFRRERRNVPWKELRDDFDLKVIEHIKRFKPTVSMQAGYMLYAPILCKELLILNQHPALPGGAIGMWQDAIWDVIETNATETGSTIHLSTTELDRGPVVSTCRFSIRGGGFDAMWHAIRGQDLSKIRTQDGENLTLFTAIRQESLLRERPLVVETLKAISEERIDISVIASGDPFTSLDMTDAVECIVAENQLCNDT